MLESDDDKYYKEKSALPALHAALERAECPTEGHTNNEGESYGGDRECVLRKRWEDELFTGIYCGKEEWLRKECGYQNISTGMCVWVRVGAGMYIPNIFLGVIIPLLP